VTSAIEARDAGTVDAIAIEVRAIFIIACLAQAAEFSKAEAGLALIAKHSSR
jgi:hypothetical protein